MPDDAPRRRLTIADLKVSPKLAAAAQGEAREPPKAAARPSAPLKPAKPPQPRAEAVKPVERAKPAAKPPEAPKPALPATAYVPPAVPQTVTRDADGFPCGWCFAQQSWTFHRSLWVEHGIRLELGEYGHIKRQCRPGGGGEKLAPHVWRVALRGGQQIVVGVHALPVAVLSDTSWEGWVAVQQEKDLRRRARKATRVETAETTA
jgi:hypothetical protein